MALMQGGGITIDLPAGWDAEIYQRPADGATLSADGVPERTNAVMHAANFPLPEPRGDFGSGAVEVMQRSNLLIVQHAVRIRQADGDQPVVASAQDVQSPGGHFFDDNETVHEPTIEAIAALGITSGCVTTGAAYCPDMFVTRAQMATFIARALGMAERSITFDDVVDGSAHAGNIAAIRHAGITLGCNSAGTSYCPDDLVSREQMASFLARGFGLAPRSSGPFSDISGTHVGNINAIAYDGITLGCNTDGTAFCPDNSVTRGQLASFLARGMDLEPVELLPRLKLAGEQTVCSREVPTCSGISGGPPTSGDFYIQEGWFYSLPYTSGDRERFAGAEFRLYIDGQQITDLVPVPTTDLFGTMVTLEGYLVTDLDAGVHTVIGEWWWDGAVAFTAIASLNVTG